MVLQFLLMETRKPSKKTSWCYNFVLWVLKIPWLNWGDSDGGINPVPSSLPSSKIYSENLLNSTIEANGQSPMYLCQPLCDLDTMKQKIC